VARSSVCPTGSIPGHNAAAVALLTRATAASGRRSCVLSQAPDNHERRGVWFGPWIDSRKRARHGQRRPERDLLLAGQIGARLRDANDLETLTPQRDSSADYG
jgi:hypothetical protein